MLLFLDGEYVKSSALLAPKHADNASGAYIKGKHCFLVLYRIRHSIRLLPACGPWQRYERPGPYRCHSGSGTSAGSRPPPH